MNTGQMLLVLGAIVLFGIILLSVHQVLMDSRVMAVEARVGPLAVAIGQGRVERLASAGYNATALEVDGSTWVGLDTNVVGTVLDTFTVITRVNYVEAAALNDTVTAVTRLKRVMVTVSNPYLHHPLAFSTIVGQY